ncbi:terminase family protein [Flavobacterium chryseum]|uniref:terminase large subunit domain-containing protein n=1 Tax=Flavobacterium sp. P3160 TaxID=2512113 RepID=UPI00105DCB13|nr:terminase family protein [Flavobacterium sp. P3160]TDO68838.1 terminase family protein [Flavobacterium sp. P3160]
MELLEHQAEFIESDFIHTGIVGGFRSGKSQAGAIKTCLKKFKYPGIDVAYYLPTYGLIKDIAYPKFSKLLEDFGCEYVLNKTDHEFITPFGRIILRSMDNPDTIIGYEVGYSLIDEADILSTAHMKDVFIKVVARLSVPLPDGMPNCLDFVSTPEGFKFLYDFFVKKPHAKKKLIKAQTKNNPFISESYIETLKMNYTEAQLEAYLEGEFVNLTSGSVYRNFSRITNHSDRAIKSTDVLHIGMDFNITKMNAVVHVIDGTKKIAVAEIVNAYDTPEMCGLIKEKFPNHSIVIYPDASGDNRKSSGKSDIQILKDNKFVVRKLSKNPFVKDRVNAVNIGFKPAKGDPTYFVNTNTCPVYTEALEQQAYKNGEPDKTTGFDHINEAGGYFAYYQTNKVQGAWGSSKLA